MPKEEILTSNLAEEEIKKRLDGQILSLWKSANWKILPTQSSWTETYNDKFLGYTGKLNGNLFSITRMRKSYFLDFTYYHILGSIRPCKNETEITLNYTMHWVFKVFCFIYFVWVAVILAGFNPFDKGMSVSDKLTGLFILSILFLLGFSTKRRMNNERKYINQDLQALLEACIK